MFVAPQNAKAAPLETTVRAAQPVPSIEEKLERVTSPLQF